MAKISQFLLWPIVYFLSKFLYKIRIQGRENLKKVNKPFIIISNHFSFYDSFLFRLVLGFFTPNLPLRFMAVRKFRSKITNFLVKVGLIDLIYKIFGAITVVPGLGIEKNLIKIKQAIMMGQNVVIYPEGSIYKNKTISPFKNGAAVLAIESEAPVLPVSFRIHERRLGHPELVINIGEPIYVKNNSNVEDVTNIFYTTIIKLYETIDNYNLKN